MTGTYNNGGGNSGSGSSGGNSGGNSGGLAQNQGLHRNPSNNNSNHNNNNNNHHHSGNKHLQSIRSKAAGKGQEKAKSLTDISSSSLTPFVASLQVTSHGGGGSHQQGGGGGHLRHHNLRVLEAKRPGSCFFCLKPGRSTCPINSPYQHILSTHAINTYCQ